MTWKNIIWTSHRIDSDEGGYSWQILIVLVTVWLESVWHLLSHLSSHNYIVIADHWLTVGSWSLDDVLTAQPGLTSICSCISALIVWCLHDSSILWPWILAFITSETLLLSEAANTVGCTSDFVMKLSAVLNRIIFIEKSGSPRPSCHSSSVSDAKLLQQNMDLHQSDFHGVFCLMTFWCVSLYPVIVGRKQDVTVE